MSRDEQTGKTAPEIPNEADRFHLGRFDLKNLLAGFGYELAAGGRTGGSRVRFLHPERPPISMHKPHPTPVLKRYQIEQILEFLKKEGGI